MIFNVGMRSNRYLGAMAMFLKQSLIDPIELSYTHFNLSCFAPFSFLIPAVFLGIVDF